MALVGRAWYRQRAIIRELCGIVRAARREILLATQSAADAWRAEEEAEKRADAIALKFKRYRRRRRAG